MAKDAGLVLLVDDDAAIRAVLGSLLKQEGYRVLTAASGGEALALLDKHPIDAVVTDLRMPGMDGMTLLRRVTQAWPEVPVVVLSAHGTVALAVDAMKGGAADFLTKPFERDEVLFVLGKVLRGAASSQRRPPATFSPLGGSSVMAEVRDTIRRAATSSATVLILGESGSGKEVVARAIHETSPRAGKPFIKLNCAAFPETLLESELFGYEKGAFTGASQRKPGRIELAHGGTLLLDEIGEVPLTTQAKLLRAIQFKEVERLGGTQTTKVDVRFLVATHRDLQSMIEDGEFRQDLYYRLNVIRLLVPPLRERADDLQLLAEHFVAQAAENNGRSGVALAPDALELLLAQSWPGNVRQLENFMERLVVLSDGPTLTRADVERELLRDTQQVRTARSSAPPSEPRLEDHRREADRKAIAEALQRSSGNRSLAARMLGISRRTLYTKLDELDLRDPEPESD
ncbi:MAG TPA: sigma-54 dependent transcriptional regulator [Polyangiaceae bacterium]|nr:sigma-54 dependent transcriptional regulator [Polyangiaceae bacterium]